MSILEITAIVGAIAAVISTATKVGPAAGKRFGEWTQQRVQNRQKWNALEATVEIESSDEYFYQLKSRGRNRERVQLSESRTAIRRDSCLLLEEGERPAHVTIRTKGEGTIILRTGWRRRNISPGSTFELRAGFREARIYMKKAKRAKDLPTPNL